MKPSSTVIAALLTIGAIAIGFAYAATPASAIASEALLRAADGRMPEFLACLREQKIALILAHRGGASPEHPENAIETMLRTTSLAPVIVETDVQQTSDDILFIHHDAILDRTTTGKGRVNTYGWAEIEKLWLRDPLGETTIYHPPRFADVLDAGKGRFLIAIDIKGASHDRITHEVAEAKAKGRVIYLGLSYEEASAVARSQPKATFAMRMSDLDRLGRPGALGLGAKNAVIALAPAQLAPHLIEKIEAAGAAVISWATGGPETADAIYKSPADSAAYRSLMNNGARLIISNRPMEATAALLSAPGYRAKLSHCLSF